MTLTLHLELSPFVTAVIILASVLTFLGVVMATKIITGEEQIVYYHHEIAVMIVAALVLQLLRQPGLPYLDVTILCIGVFLACGRVGCLMGGCCHGRPHRWGVCYRREHAEAGFTPYYVGVRLFPIQAVESLWVLSVVVAGVSFVLSGYPQGTALAWYVVTYGLGRFYFEFVRGDAERPYYVGFSQGQWISLLLICFVASAEWIGLLPLHVWHIGATVCLAVTMIAVALRRRFQRPPTHRLLNPRHVKEVAEAVELISAPANEATAIGDWTVLPGRNPTTADIRIGCTSLGIQISAGRMRTATGDMQHFALSSERGRMTEETARVLAGLIVQLKRAAGSSEFVKGKKDVFHVLIHQKDPKELAC